MAGQRHQTAMLLWGVTYRGRREDINLLADIFADMLRSRSKDPRTIKGKYRKIALTVIAWHLHGVCQHCSGRGYDVIPDSPVLSDDLCPSCGGTGKMPLPRSDAHRWLADEIGALQAMAAASVMRKLDLDLG